MDSRKTNGWKSSRAKSTRALGRQPATTHSEWPSDTSQTWLVAVPAVLAHVSVRSSTLVLPLEQSCLALGLPTAVDAFTAQVSQPRAAQLSTTQQLPLKINAFIACSIDCAWLDADGIGGLHWPLGEALPPPKGSAATQVARASARKALVQVGVRRTEASARALRLPWLCICGCSLPMLVVLRLVSAGANAAASGCSAHATRESSACQSSLRQSPSPSSTTPMR